MKLLPPSIGRALVAVMLTVVGVTFIFFGYEFAHAGGGFGVGLILVGICPLLLATVYLWSGGRLGAEIQHDTLIVRSYLRRHDAFIPLVRLLAVRRGASDDATVLEFPDRQFILDDSYFSDTQARDAVLRSLQSYAKRDVA